MRNVPMVQTPILHRTLFSGAAEQQHFLVRRSWFLYRVLLRLWFRIAALFLTQFGEVAHTSRPFGPIEPDVFPEGRA